MLAQRMRRWGVRRGLNFAEEGTSALSLRLLGAYRAEALLGRYNIWRCRGEWDINVTARAQIHRLVDALPDDALDTVEHMLAEFAPTITDQRAVTAKVPTEGRTPVAPADAAEERLHGFFRRFEGRSLADELIAERREEARRESP